MTKFRNFYPWAFKESVHEEQKEPLSNEMTQMTFTYIVVSNSHRKIFAKPVFGKLA